MKERILITGHKGKLGSAFVEKYKNDFEIVGYDIADGDDLLDYEKLKQTMAGCSQVVHLAAIPRPVEGKGFEEYFQANDLTTLNVIRAATAHQLKRIIYASSTSIYGVEVGIPFKTPIKEDQPFVSQYIPANRLSCGGEYLAYHDSKVIAEQMLSWYGLMKKIQTVALRFGPIDVKYLGTSVSINNATQAIKLVLDSAKEFWYEPFTIVDELPHIDITKAKTILGYQPEKPDYSKYLIVSDLDARAT